MISEMRRVSKRNISNKIADVRRPEAPLGTPRTKLPIPPPPFNTDSVKRLIYSSERLLLPPAAATRKFSWRGIIQKAAAGGGILALLGVGISVASFYEIKNKLSASASLGIEHFQSAVSDLKMFNFKQAQERAATGEEKIQELSDKLAPFQALLTANPGGSFIPVFKDIGETYGDLQVLSFSALTIVEDLAGLQRSWSKILRGEGGEEVITALEGLRDNLASISESSNRLVNQSSKYKDFLPVDTGSYLSFRVDINRGKNFLDALIPWLKSPEEHRLVLLLQNPSELRPGGGFSGSYAEVVLKNANVRRIDVHDIAHADRELDLKTIPPQPLQALVKNWRAADANWFFDFSDSSRKTLELLEASQIYQKDDIHFDGVIGISAGAVTDLLALTGPIDFEGRSISENNFLYEIQKEVQSGHDVGSPYAKRILSELAPSLQERLANLPEEKQTEFMRLVQKWITTKELSVYFKDQAFQRFFDGYHATGRVADLPSDRNGDYLAVVNANIGGGKTDIFMHQKVVLQSQIGTDGVLSNHLTVTRRHTADEASAWWYQMTNQNYLQVFTPADAQLEYANGGFEKKIKAPLRYETEGYVADPAIVALEATRWEHMANPTVTSYRQSNKNVFATWSRTPLGETTTLAFDYTRHLFSPPSDGGTHHFIFEKQAGAKGEYKFEFTAPVGFKFKENNLPVFEYATNDPPARLALDLTLEKILFSDSQE